MDDHPRFFIYSMGDPVRPDAPAGTVLVSAHPRAYKREDGRTYCPSCRAVAVDPTVLEELSCTDKPRPINEMPAFPLLGDVWKEEKRWWVFGVPDDEEEDTGGEWLALDSRKPRGGQLFLFGHGLNPGMLGLEITGNIPPSGLQEGRLDDHVQDYYRSRLAAEFQNALITNRLVQVTPLRLLRWERDEEGVHVLAKTMVRPDPRMGKT